jgi:hypothetical protein
MIYEIASILALGAIILKIVVIVTLVLLAYVPKMKVGLSNHQSVCSPLITFEPPGKSS